MLPRTRAILAIAILPVLAIGLAACGGSSSSNDSSTSGSGPAAGGSTVATKSFPGTGTVLVDSSGAPLYTNDMDTRNSIACTGQCVTEWVPLAAPAGGPTASDTSLGSRLGTVKRPDGSTQVTLDGMPLYTFVEDTGGQVTGDGFADQFGGTHFTWTVARSSGSGGSGGSGASPATTTTQSPGGYGGGY